MLAGLTALLVCQLAGELIVALLRLPIPGPICGMALLLAALVVRGGIPEPIAAAADGLMSNLSLLFVPAGVGVMLHAALIGRDWLPITLSLVASTLLSIAVTALVMVRLGRIAEPAASQSSEEAGHDA
jgi:putative effector of murein hydrolase LrgA (UPF0299 family)